MEGAVHYYEGSLGCGRSSPLRLSFHGWSKAQPCKFFASYLLRCILIVVTALSDARLCDQGLGTTPGEHFSGTASRHPEEARRIP